jgi:hypothetical protein
VNPDLVHDARPKDEGDADERVASAG